MRGDARTTGPADHKGVGLMIFLGLVAAVIALTGIPGTAFAAPGDLPDLTPDKAFGMFNSTYGDPFTSVFLNQIFGPLFPTVNGSATTTVFSEIIGYFNVFVMTVGLMLFFYNVTVGVLQSAHEGEILGRGQSSLWVPLRMVFAVGMIVPVLNGYNTAQAGVAFVVRGATSIASFVWEQGATLVISGKIPITAPQVQIDPEVVRGIYRTAACMRIMNDQFAIAADAGTNPKRVVMGPTVAERNQSQEITPDGMPMPAEGSPTGRMITRTYLQDPTSGTLSQPDICGSFSTPVIPQFLSRIIPDEQLSDIEGLPAENASQALMEFQKAHTDSMNYLRQQVDAVVAGAHSRMSSLGQPVPDISTGLQEAIRGANHRLQEGMNKVTKAAAGSDMEGQQARDAMLKRIKGNCSAPTSGVNANTADPTSCYGEGWIGAGSWYMMIARMNNELSSLAKAKASTGSAKYLDQSRVYVESGGETGWFGRVGEERVADANLLSQDERKLLTARYDEAYSNAAIGMASLGVEMGSETLNQLNETTDADTLLNALPNMGITQWAMDLLVDTTSPGNWSEDPMIGITNMGNAIVSVASVLIGISFVAGGGVSFLGFGATIPAGMATALQLPSAILMGSGVTMSFIIPMMPFILWIMAVTGYFIMVVEAVVAAPLWALGILRPEGTGLAGQHGQYGWNFALSLLLSPVLMVFGYFLGMTIFRITIALFDLGIHQALSGVMGGGILTLFAAVIVYGAMMAGVYLMIIERSFSLVSELPSRVLRWMGSHVDGLADGGLSRGAVAAGAAFAGKAAHSGVTGAAVVGGAVQRRVAAARTAVGNGGGAPGGGAGGTPDKASGSARGDNREDDNPTTSG